ncbi:nucleotide exchange factor GrpE [Rhodospirillaceae bacterium KN72]|uniref:Protein GrpE n=1 Tax=Pacificispira spongiicola TaxID=2729598 RepID=A0A7Y0HGK6_9PROT|nr:nucleotide exchange factor GrpE [Pacificispira spongiicola]NMM45052.1 nucleotide exchange factor GrpE [Pacificispira spongiicola]
MSDENKNPANETETPEAGAETEGADTQRAEAEAPADPIEALKAELAAMKDKALRAVAEAENVRRRADKERADTLKYASAGLAKELLPVVDNLRRAVDSVPEADREANDVLKNLLVGVEMTEKMLLDAFGKSGILKIDPLDEKFNYAEHQAIQEVPGTGKPGGTVVQVLQSGYKLHDRLLRPAMVLVAKADPAAPPEDPEKVDTSA